jgi:adenylylsulfate kinase-like enzyme
MIYLFIGQPGSGKTTIANKLLATVGHHRTIMIDGDELREIFPNTDYSEKGRIENITRAFTIARFCNQKKFNVVISMVCPYRELREQFKSDNPVIEILVKREDVGEKIQYNVKNFEEPEKNFIELDNNGTLNDTLTELYKKLFQ